MARLSLSHDRDEEAGDVNGGGIGPVSVSGTSAAVPPPPPATKASEELLEKWRKCHDAGKDPGECLDEAEREGLELLHFPSEYYAAHGITLEQRRNRLARVHTMGKAVSRMRDKPNSVPDAKLLQLLEAAKSP